MTTHLRALTRATAVAAAGLVLCTGMAVAVPTTSFKLFGEVQNPGVYDREALENFAPQVRSHTTGSTDTYQGASLWSVLDDAGLVTDSSFHNDILNKVVVATASDGYKVTFSLGEIHPGFGGVGEPHILAYDILNTDTGNFEPLTFNGFARVVSPDDSRRGRFLSNLESLEVVSAARSTLPPVGGRSESFTLSGDVGLQGTIAAGDLAGLNSVTREVSYQSGGGMSTHTFTGVSLWDFLTSRDLNTDDLLRKALVVSATDGYQAVFTLGELSPNFGDPNSLAMIALEDSNGPLGDNGFARLVLPGDLRGGRFLSNISGMHIVDITSATVIPLPAGLALALTGAAALAGVGGMRRRSSRLA